MGLGDALAEYRKALKLEGLDHVLAVNAAAAAMAQAIEDHIVGEAMKAGQKAQDKPYPPNVMCCCGELIHPDMPNVELQPGGRLFHWNDEGGGHSEDADSKYPDEKARSHGQA